MLQSTLHVAIIMDGNGRWAVRRGLPRAAGHRAGANALRLTVEAAPALGIGALTVYAFSSDNWSRPAAEVGVLMALLARHLESEIPRCRESGVRVHVLGRRDRIPRPLAASIEAAESATRGGENLDLRIAIDYSARDSIFTAAQLAGRHTSRAQFESAIGAAVPVDLLIRTGGEQRLSDFLLWECAYAELYFTPTLWPDFSAHDLRRALSSFARRTRTFGSVPVPSPLEPLAPDRWLR